jgi:hypothetical protein
MAADSPPAFFARPLFSLVSEECRHAFTLDEIQIGQHAHVIVPTVPFIQMFKAGARASITLITIFPSVAQALGAFFNHAVDAAIWLVFIFVQAPRALVSVTQVRGADGAVHATRSNEFFNDEHQTESNYYEYSITQIKAKGKQKKPRVKIKKSGFEVIVAGLNE